MKRPPGIWILLSAGVLWLCFHNVYGVRATALIFGKSTTTTTPGPVANATDGLESEVVTEASSESSNVTKPALTGNPQLDYIYDPNLPKELNGYNLSEYPFYERVPDPDEIDFKCDGLHDGFYASIEFKCQVYHHCLFGTRYDFLCANYTAFDQKTFICQFVSDVDCVGSKKFWHRNDALYKAQSTTTAKPLSIYTTPPQQNSEKGGGGSRGGGKRRIRPLARRPQYDYYDYADYDEDYYEDRPRPRRRKPRPRPRPIYEDEYEEDYDEETYEQRNRRPFNRRGGSARRRNKNRNKHRDDSQEDDFEQPRDRKKFPEEEEEDRTSERRKPTRDDESTEDLPNERRKPIREGDGRINTKRKPQRFDDSDGERSKKPLRDDIFEDERPLGGKRKPIRDENGDEDYDLEPSRRIKSSKRPAIEDEYDNEYSSNDRNRKNRPKKKQGDNLPNQESRNKPLVIPTTGTIYDRPRVAPRIKPPVPKNEANKYAYKTLTKQPDSLPLEEEDYYEDYEEDLSFKNTKGKKSEVDPIKPKSSEHKENKQIPSSLRTSLDEEDDALILSHNTKSKTEFPRGRDRYRSKFTSTTTKEPILREDTQNIQRSENRKKPFHYERSNRGRSTTEKPSDMEYFDEDYDVAKSNKESPEISTQPQAKKWRPSSTSIGTTTVITAITTTTKPTTTSKVSHSEGFKERPEQVVRIVKRPFLPSRGGNPYSPRGLQPVGFKAPKSEVMEQQGSVDVHKKIKETYVDQPTYVNTNEREISSDRYRPKPLKKEKEQIYQAETQNEDSLKRNLNEPVQQTNPIKPFIKSKFSEPISEDDDDFRPIQRPQSILKSSYDVNSYSGPRTTQKPKLLDKDPLDIDENEYDVTLNDALNPTLPNLPVKANFPTGFSPANDYTFSAFQRPRYVLEPGISATNTDYIYRSNQPIVRQRFEAIPQSYNSREQFSSNTNDFKSYYVPVANGNTKRGITQTQSHPLYTTRY